MATLTPERALELLGGGPAERLNGHDLVAGHADRSGMTLITRPRRAWPGRQRDQRGKQPRETRPGMRLIGTGAVLLVLLGGGLLAVSYAAQYRYVLHQRHQVAASLVEAGALDIGLVIFSLIALGLALAGLPAKTERAAIVACAVASAVMNYAAADVTSPRSVLAFCMPPVFLAFVVDRVVSAARRHVLGIREGRSPWAAVADTVGRGLRFTGVLLYVLRFVVAAPSTCSGLRRAILAATPLPGLPGKTEAGPGAAPPRGQRTGRRRAASQGTKTARFLRLVTGRHGELACIPLDQVSKIATAIAPQAGLHAASARTALLAAVRAAQASAGGVTPALPAAAGDAR